MKQLVKKANRLIERLSDKIGVKILAILFVNVFTAAVWVIAQNNTAKCGASIYLIVSAIATCTAMYLGMDNITIDDLASAPAEIANEEI
jgi:hypothetical protein